MLELLTSQLAVQATTIIILLLSVGLAVVITRKCIAKPSRPLMLWSIGLWLFVLGVLIEVVFAYNAYSEFLIASYLFVVALLVEFLAMGSMQLVDSHRLRLAYYAYNAVFTLLLLYSLVASHIGYILTEYVVFGNLPYWVAIWSAFITFPAALVLVIVAAKSYIKKRSNKLLSIIVGVIVVSVAGTLYLVQYPAFLYLSEFVGILCLWYGFI